jgi:molybdate transport system permease protein
MDWQAFGLTIRLALLVAAVLIILGLPIAYWIAFSHWRWKFLAVWQTLTGHTLAFTFSGLVIGSIIYSLPFAVQPFAASFVLVDPRLMAASATLGASKPRTFFRVILPLSVPGLVTGVALSFAHTMGEFGVVLMVGGNIPGVTRTVSIDIYDKVQSFNYAAANQTALLLLAISFATLSLVYSVNRKVSAVWPWK